MTDESVRPGPLVCPVCDTPTVPGARFCHACGAALDVGSAGIDSTADRRLVTVLFGDLSDFTAWSEDLDPERVGVVTDRVLATLSKAVTDHGGTVDKLTGDGIMAVFGAPTAHEDDTERAVRAAARMQSAVRRLMAEETGGGRRMGLRVGLNTGEVLAGVQASLAYTVVGDTVNTASRLSDAASIGAVYAGRGTALATMPVASWRALPALRLKGKREPVPAYELVGLRSPGAERLGLGDEAPFIGRDAEFGRLVGRVLDVVERDTPGSVVVTGEAGVGKTRLAIELARFAGELPAVRVLWGRCPPYGETRELSALAGWMRTAFGITEDDDVTESEGRARRTLARLSAPSVDRPLGGATVDRLLGLLGLAEWSPPGPRDAAAPGTADLPQDPVVDAVASVLAALLSEGPLVLVVDDAQWATGDLLAALAHLATVLAGPVLFVTVGRSDVLTSVWWDRMPDLEVLPVAPLEEPAADRLLRAYLGGAELDAATRELLLGRAQGNPFFLAEMLHLLVDRGLLRRVRDGWRLTGDLPREVLPVGVQAVLAARIDSLQPATRALVRDASVIGNRFTADLLRALAPEPGPADSEDAIERGLQELISRGIVAPTGELGDGTDVATSYSFVHALAQDVAYAGIPKAERAHRHARVAAWAAAGRRRGSPSEVDGLVAGQAEQAVGFAALVRLGDGAVVRDDNQRADGLFSRALEVAADAVGGDERDRALVGRAAARVALHQLSEAEADLDTPRQSRDLRIRAAALVVVGDLLRRRGEEDRATEALVSALAAASESGYDRVTGEALRQLGMLDYLAGRLRGAEERFSQALALAERVGDRRGAGWALQHLAWSATTRGDYELAERTLAVAGDVFASLDDDGGMSWCAGTEAFVRLMQGRHQQARQLASGLLPLGRAMGDRWGTAACLTIDGFAAAELGEIDVALEECRAAYDEFTELGDTWGRCMALVATGVALRGQGRHRRAGRRLAEAIELAKAEHHLAPRALALGVLGYLRLDLGDAPGAERAATDALELMSSLDVREGALAGLRVLRAQALLAIGEDRAAALELLSQARLVREASLIFPRRQALAHLADALLADGDVSAALATAHEAMAEPAEDLRSRIVTLRVLGACLAAAGDSPAGRFALRQSVALAGSTQLRSELPASQKALQALG
jgi:class 3 adenylate cyclase/tetratricopeptide (TPR) repeat protein